MYSFLLFSGFFSFSLYLFNSSNEVYLTYSMSQSVWAVVTKIMVQVVYELQRFLTLLEAGSPRSAHQQMECLVSWLGPHMTEGGSGALWDSFMEALVPHMRALSS